VGAGLPSVPRKLQGHLQREACDAAINCVAYSLRFVPIDLELLTLNNAQHPLRDWRISMTYAIIGSGKILHLGQQAHKFLENLAA
jgi:hypothetical protein